MLNHNCNCINTFVKFTNLHWIQHQYWYNRQYLFIWKKVFCCCFLIKLRFLLIFLFIYQSIDFLGGHHWRNRQRRYGLWWCVHLPWTLYSLDIIQYNIDSSSPLLIDQSLFLCSTCILGCAWVCAKVLYVNVLELKGVLRHHIVYIFIEYFFLYKWIFISINEDTNKCVFEFFFLHKVTSWSIRVRLQGINYNFSPVGYQYNY